MSSNDRENNNSCTFCKIALKLDESTELLFEDSNFVVFKDIRPASKHHYLVVTKEHISSVKCLKADDIPLIKQMQEIGLKVLKERGGDLNDTRLGFHWPPFNTISHLHLHVISPQSEMSFFQRFLFRPNSFYFATVDETIQWLNSH